MKNCSKSWGPSEKWSTENTLSQSRFLERLEIPQKFTIRLSMGLISKKKEVGNWTKSLLRKPVSRANFEQIVYFSCVCICKIGWIDWIASMLGGELPFDKFWKPCGHAYEVLESFRQGAPRRPCHRNFPARLASLKGGPAAGECPYHPAGSQPCNHGKNVSWESEPSKFHPPARNRGFW